MAADDDYLDFLNRTQTTQPGRTISPTSGTVTRPSTIPGTNLPVPTTRPSRPASVRRGAAGRAESELEDLWIRSQNLGLNPPASLAPESVTTKPEEEDKPWWKDLASMTGSVVGGALNILSIPQRIILSTGTEVSELIPNEWLTGELKYSKPERDASFSDWWNQIKDKNFNTLQAGGVNEPGQLTYSYLQMFGLEGPEGDRSKYKWVDFVYGLGADIATDPLSYLTLGGSAVAKTTVKRGSEQAAAHLSRVVADEGVEALIRAGADARAVDALDISNKLYGDAVGALENAKLAGDANMIARYSDEVKTLEQTVRRNSDNIALDLFNKGVNIPGADILAAEQRRLAAAARYADTPAYSAQKKVLAKELDRATEDLVRAGRGKALRRGYGANVREELANNVRQAKLFAQEQLIKNEDSINRGLGPILSSGDKRLYEMTIDLITDKTIKDVATKGWNAMRGDLARIMGATTKSSLGVGKFRAFLPGSDLITKTFGDLAVRSRLAALSTPIGETLLDVITPLGRRGIFTEDQVLSWRKALRSGKVPVSKANQYVALLAAQKDSVISAAAKRNAVGSTLRNALSGITEEEGVEIRRLLEAGAGDNPLVRLTTSYGTRVSPEFQSKFMAVKALLDNWWNEVDSFVKRQGGAGVARIKNYFPHTQTEDALKWIRNNPDAADELAASIGVNRQYLADNFIQRQLVKDSKWFGQTLRGDETVDELNAIARQFGDLDFDFFETDLRKALSGYAATHARQMATLESAVRLADKLEGLPSAVKAVNPRDPEELRQAALEIIRGGPNNPIGLQDKMDLLESSIARSVFSDAQDLANQVKSLKTALQKVSDSVMEVEGWKTFEPYKWSELTSRLDVIDTFIADISDYIMSAAPGVAAGGTMGWGPGWFIGAAADLLPNLGQGIKDIDTLIANLDPAVWRGVNQALETGWTTLKVGSSELMNVQVRQELEGILGNLRRLNDPKFTRTVENLLNDYNSFFKTYATATPGFHFRNLLGNVFMLTAAGVNPSYAREAVRINGDFFKKNRNLFRRGQKAVTPQQFVIDLEGVSALDKRLILQALELSDETAGQVMESLARRGDTYTGEFTEEGIFRGWLNRVYGTEAVGITGRPVDPNTLLGTTRRTLGAPLTASRALGSRIEKLNRFILTYDGLKKGLSPAEALARTNKYLLDYSDLSKADRVMKQIIPFWYWSSRTMPLIAEILVTNPKALSRVAILQRDITSEDGTYIPEYLQQRGAVPIGNRMIFAPDLGVIGAGTPNPLTQLLTALPRTIGGEEEAYPEAFKNLASSLTPALRVPIEMGLGRQFFRDKQIVNPYSDMTPLEQQALYAAQQFSTPVSAVARLANALTGWVPEGEVAQRLTGLNVPYSEGLTKEEFAKVEEDAQLRRLLQYLGSPIRNVPESDELAEIARRRRALEDLIRQQQFRR